MIYYFKFDSLTHVSGWDSRFKGAIPLLSESTSHRLFYVTRRSQFGDHRWRSGDYGWFNGEEWVRL
mgnify:FL=1